MDTQFYINASFFIITTLLGVVSTFFWRDRDRIANDIKGLQDRFSNDIKGLQDSHHNQNINVARDYVTRAEMQKAMDRVIDKLDEIQRDVRDIKK